MGVFGSKLRNASWYDWSRSREPSIFANSRSSSVRTSTSSNGVPLSINAFSSGVDSSRTGGGPFSVMLSPSDCWFSSARSRSVNPWRVSRRRRLLRKLGRLRHSKRRRARRQDRPSMMTKLGSSRMALRSSMKAAPTRVSGYCQVDENRCDRPTRYCGRSPSWADMLGIRIGLMP